MFHVHFKVFGFEKRCGFFKDSQQLACGQPMVGIIRKPCLKAAICFRAKCPAAINEALVYLGNFGDMSMRRNFAARRQNKPNVFFTALSQQFFEFGQIHNFNYAASAGQTSAHHSSIFDLMASRTSRVLASFSSGVP